MMASLWLAFNGLDSLTTYIALRVGAIEANPVMSGISSAVGEIPGYAMKLAFAAAVAILLYRTRKVRLFKWLNLGMAVIVIFNVGVLTFCLLA
jgi:hypothetical protein